MILTRDLLYLAILVAVLRTAGPGDETICGAEIICGGPCLTTFLLTKSILPYSVSTIGPTMVGTGEKTFLMKALRIEVGFCK